MIARMSKYNFVLFAAQSEDFVEKLRGLGLVDITTAGWEPSEEDRQLLLDIESLAKAAEFLKNFRAGERCDAAAAPFASGEEAYAHYAAAHREAATLNAEIGRLEKAAEELRPWGAFDVEATRKLAARGIVLRYFFTQRNTFDKQLAEWSERYTVSEVSRTDATVWFVVVAKPGEEVTLDAQEMKTPTMDIREAERRIAEAEGKLRTLDAEFSRAAASEALLAQHACSLKERLQGVRVKATAQEAADGTLVVMEGWAEKETSGRVDALLEEYPNVVFLKSDPTPEDETPVKLKNRWFAHVFELVGDMYARPKYGTMDLTPFFAPFYMLFFGICLNDAGYGLILTLMGWWMLARNRKPGMMRQAAWFATLCGVSTVAFGLLCGSFFGINMNTWFPSVKFLDFQGQFFSIALVIGVVQILFGMLLNIWMTVRCFGFGRALGLLGWFIILVSCCLAMGLPMAGLAIPGFTAGSAAFDAASEQSEAQSAHQPRRGFVGPLQQPHGTVERRAVLYPSVRHRAFGRCAGAGVQHAGVGIRARRREHRGPAADYDSDSADRSRHQPFHVDHLVVRAPAASDVRRVFQERRFRNGPAQFRPDS